MNKCIKTLLVALILSSSFTLVAQDYSKLKDIKLTDSKSCLNAQPKVMECCNYLLNQPCVENVTGAQATLFIMSWMESTPDYTLAFEKDFYKLVSGNSFLSGRYFASLVKVAIENKYTKNSVDLQLKAITKVLDYSEKPSNKVKVTAQIKKYIDAKNANRLKELIKVQ